MSSSENKIKSNLRANAALAAREQREKTKKLANPKHKRTGTRAIARAARKEIGIKSSARGMYGIRIEVQKNGCDIKKLLAYAQKDGKDPEMILSNCGNYEDAEKAIKVAGSLRTDIKNPVGHITMAIPLDSNFDPTKWSELVNDARRELGMLDDMPFIAVRHNDTDHDHIHLIFSRVSLSGKVHDQANLGYMCSTVAEKIEQKYNLSLHPISEDADIKRPTKKEIERAIRTGEPSSRMTLQNLCNDAMADCHSITDYFNRLEVAGVLLDVITQEYGTKLSGITYHFDGVTMKASDLGKRYAPNGLNKKGVTYDKNRDGETIERIKDQAIARQFGFSNEEFAELKLQKRGRDGASITTIGNLDEPIVRNPDGNSRSAENGNEQAIVYARQNEHNQQANLRNPTNTANQHSVDDGWVNGDSDRSFERPSDRLLALAKAASDSKQPTSARHSEVDISSYAYKSASAQIKALGLDGLDGVVVKIFVADDKSKKPIPCKFPARDLGKYTKFLLTKSKQGSDIYIQPDQNKDHSLVLLDDLDIVAIEQLKSDGFEPACVIQTSPNNFQAWVNLSDKPVKKDIRLEISRTLTKRYGGDDGAIGADRLGRLSGFVNRKQKHMRNGESPYVKTHEASGKIATRGKELIAETEHKLAKQAHDAIKQERIDSIKAAPDHFKWSIDNARKFFAGQAKEILEKYGNQTDLSKLDFMVIKNMLHKSFSHEQIADAMQSQSPNISTRKSDVDDYIQRTIEAARKKLIEERAQANNNHKRANNDNNNYEP